VLAVEKVAAYTYLQH
jgi:hypothetical protein